MREGSVLVFVKMYLKKDRVSLARQTSVKLASWYKTLNAGILHDAQIDCNINSFYFLSSCCRDARARLYFFARNSSVSLGNIHPFPTCLPISLPTDVEVVNKTPSCHQFFTELFVGACYILYQELELSWRL